jgi:hypothetical protein
MIRTKEKPLPTDIKDFMKLHSVTQELAADCLGVTVRQIYRYVHGITMMSPEKWYWLRREVLERKAIELQAVMAKNSK